MSGGTQVFVQARLGSTRLAGKSMAEISGRPALAWIVERVSRAPGIDGAAVLTTEDPGDEPIRALCRELGVPCVAGADEDVLDRFLKGVRELGPSHVVRVTADCPLVDPAVIGTLVALYRERLSCDHAGVATGAMAARPGLRRYPDGLDAEMLSAETLELAGREASDPFEREHVSPFVWRRPERFDLAVLEAPEDWGEERWTVDHPADLEFVRAVYERLGGDGEFGVADVLELLRREPSLREINAAERQAARPVR